MEWELVFAVFVIVVTASQDERKEELESSEDLS
jgi:hypothetical protein